ncbi:hypothetical protein P5E57_15795, partial [Clostridium perfringens]|nr:hypothetical protein [Clostridium perfringens]
RRVAQSIIAVSLLREQRKRARRAVAMSGIIHKIEEKLHMGGDHKNKEEEHHKKAEEHHKKEEGEHHKKDGGEHKEGIVEKIKDKITGEHGDKSGDHKEKKDKKKKKEKKKHGEGHDHDGGHSSSSSDSD